MIYQENSLNEQVHRIMEVMGLVLEQDPKIYTDKKEYDKALKTYENMWTAHLWSNELPMISKKFENLSGAKYEKICEILRTDLGKQMEKITGEHIVTIILVLGDQYTPTAKYLNTNLDKTLKKIYKRINYSMDKKYPTWTMQSLMTQKKINLPFFPKPTISKPIYKPQKKTTPPKSEPTLKPISQPTLQTEPAKVFTKPKQVSQMDGDAVYGPGNSLIGFVKDRKFTPVSDPSMMPNKNNYYGKWDWDLLQDKEKMRQFLNNKFGSYLIYESMKVDDWGRLHDEEAKIIYPYKRIAKFVNWFDKEYGDYAQKQGWFIVTSDTDTPKVRYKPEEGNKYNLFFQVQRIDDPMEGEALFGKLRSDLVADELAKKLGIELDEFGVVIGWKGESFL